MRKNWEKTEIWLNAEGIIQKIIHREKEKGSRKGETWGKDSGVLEKERGFEVFFVDEWDKMENEGVEDKECRTASSSDRG